VSKLRSKKITPATGEERGDIEIKDYVVVLQKPQGQDSMLLYCKGPKDRTTVFLLLTH
jgi:hypothetical protein